MTWSELKQIYNKINEFNHYADLMRDAYWHRLMINQYQTDLGKGLPDDEAEYAYNQIIKYGQLLDRAVGYEQENIKKFKTFIEQASIKQETEKTPITIHDIEKRKQWIEEATGLKFKRTPKFYIMILLGEGAGGYATRDGNTIVFNKKNWENPTYRDLTITHELTHAIINQNDPFRRNLSKELNEEITREITDSWRARTPAKLIRPDFEPRLKKLLGLGRFWPL